MPVSLAISLAVADPELHRDVEPGTPSPQARLTLIAAIRAAGFDCHVLVAPVLPYLTDSVEHLDALLGEIAEAGAASVTVFGLHLRGSTRGWFMSWLSQSHPELVGRYRELPPRRISASGLPRDAAQSGRPIDLSAWIGRGRGGHSPRRPHRLGSLRRCSRLCSDVVTSLASRRPVQ